MWTLSKVRRFYTQGGTPQQLLQTIFSNIEKDKEYNAWISVNTIESLKEQLNYLQANSAKDLPLWGIPFAVKDNIDYQGLPTTAACPDYAYTPTQNAPVVQRLISLGALVMGKTNLDQFATGLVGTRSPYGIVKNPLYPKYISGGSSSGSAVAMALGHVAFALGTDTAGSGRIPAAFCNLIGVKPSPGYVETQGVVPACASLDTVSLFAHNILEADELSNYLYNPSVKIHSQPITKIRIPKLEQLSFFGDQSFVPAWKEFIDILHLQNNLHIESIDIAPFLEAAKLLYQGPWIAERWDALGDFVETNAESVHPVTNQVLQGGKQVTGAQVFAGQQKLAQFKIQVQKDLCIDHTLILPTAGAIFTQAEIAAEPLLRNQELGTYTNFMNLLGLCGLAIPATKTSKGLPFGVTLVGNCGQDKALIEVAKSLELERTQIAVVGAHLRGLPLHKELVECNALFVKETQTSDQYELFALSTTPPKPGLVRSNNGANIALEIWSLPIADFGRFVSKIPFPLGIGRIELADKTWVQGFLCDTQTAQSGKNITEYKGWKNYLANKL